MLAVTYASSGTLLVKHSFMSARVDDDKFGINLSYSFESKRESCDFLKEYAFSINDRLLVKSDSF